MSTIEKLKKLLSNSKKAVVIPHINPDGDALGSCLGFAEYLNCKGHSATVISPNEFPAFYDWMPGASEIILHSSNPERATEVLNEAEVIFFLDYNDIRRVGDLKELVVEHPATFVMIDHHRQPTDFADIMFSDPEKSSTSEMIYDVISELGDKSVINKSISENLYAGILTDTGSFRFGSTKKATHLAAAHFLEVGVEPDEVYTKVYDNNTLKRIHLLGYTLVEKLKSVDDLAASYISLTEEEQRRFDFQKGDSEGFVNYGLSIGGMKAAGFFRESDGYIKVSLRSKGDFDVNVIAREHFNGGGHKNAAGGRLDISLDAAINLFKEVMRAYSNELKMY